MQNLQSQISLYLQQKNKKSTRNDCRFCIAISRTLKDRSLNVKVFEALKLKKEINLMTFKDCTNFGGSWEYIWAR